MASKTIMSGWVVRVWERTDLAVFGTSLCGEKEGCDQIGMGGVGKSGNSLAPCGSSG